MTQSFHQKTSFLDENITTSVNGALNDSKRFLLNQFKVPNNNNMEAKQQHQSNLSIDTCSTKNTGDSVSQDNMDLESCEISSVISSVNGGKRRRVRKRKKKNAKDIGNDENEMPIDSNVGIYNNNNKKIKEKGGLDQRSPCFTVPNNRISMEAPDSANKHIR